MYVKFCLCIEVTQPLQTCMYLILPVCMVSDETESWYRLQTWVGVSLRLRLSHFTTLGMPLGSVLKERKKKQVETHDESPPLQHVNRNTRSHTAFKESQPHTPTPSTAHDHHGPQPCPTGGTTTMATAARITQHYDTNTGNQNHNQHFSWQTASPQQVLAQ